MHCEEIIFEKIDEWFVKNYKIFLLVNKFLKISIFLKFMKYKKQT